MSEESKLADKYEKATQFSQEELDKIKEIQKSYVGIQQAFGQLEVNKLRLEQQMKALDIYKMHRAKNLHKMSFSKFSSHFLSKLKFFNKFIIQPPIFMIAT